MSDVPNIVMEFILFQRDAHTAREWFITHGIKEPPWLRTMIASGYRLSNYAAAGSYHPDGIERLLIDYDIRLDHPYKNTSGKRRHRRHH